jgi:hypothetical protein
VPLPGSEIMRHRNRGETGLPRFRFFWLRWSYPISHARRQNVAGPGENSLLVTKVVIYRVFSPPVFSKEVWTTHLFLPHFPLKSSVLSTQQLQATGHPHSREESPSDFDKLKFYRDEFKHEFNLLGMRSTMLVFCQSFLVVPFAILNTAADFPSVLLAEYLIGALGILLALLLTEPMNAAHRTMNMWLVKQRELLHRSETLHELASARDLIPGIIEDPRKDRDHFRSLAFSRFAPGLFIVFWLFAIAFCTFRAWSLP